MRYIIRNAIRTPDGTILESRFRHEYVNHVDENGKYYFTDGGLDYIRRTGYSDAESLDVFSDDPHELIRQHFTWATFGVKMDGDIKYVKLYNLSTDHIENILRTQTNLRDHVKKIFTEELLWRKAITG
jgi:hypothetical protein